MSKTINVVNPDGELVAIPAAQYTDAISSGYKPATTSDIQAYKDKQEFGDTSSAVGAFAEGAASGASFGLSRHLENLTGLATPEAQAKRQEYNPISSTAGEATGVIGGLFAGPGKLLASGAHAVADAALPVASKLAAKALPEGLSAASQILAKSGAHALGSSIEGAAYGLGQSVDESALGDPDAMSEKVISNIGHGAMLGGGLGALLGPLASKGAKVSEGATKSALQDDIAATTSNHLASVPDVAPEVSETVAAPRGLPQSLDEIKSRVKEAGYSPYAADGLTSSKALQNSVDVLGDDLQFKPHSLQYESLSDQSARDLYKTALEGQGEDSKALRDYEGIQKKEGMQILNNDIAKLSPTGAAESDVVSGGDRAVKAFTDQYEAEQKELAPAFKAFDEAAKGTPADAGNVILKLQDAGIDANNLIKISEDGKFHVEPYGPDMDISKNTHGALKDMVKVLNKEDVTVSQLRNLREAIRDRLTLVKGPRDEAQIGAIRKALMDEMQERVSKAAPELRDTFKRYAQNEEKRSIIEKIFGGSISDKAKFGKEIKSEDVLNRIFSDTNTVRAAKDILGPKFDQIVADHLASKIASFTDNAKNGFSSQKFATFLKNKGPELSEAFAEKPQVLKRLHALADYMRILPDSPSINPSGTAKTLGIMQRVSNLTRLLKPREALADLGEHMAAQSDAAQQRSTIDGILKGQKLAEAQDAVEQKAASYSVLAKIERAAQDTSNAIKSAAKSVFTSGTGKATAIVGAKASKNKAAQNKSNSDVVAELNELQNNPEKFTEKLNKMTQPLYAHAPAISHGMQMSMVRAVQFLQSKAPQTIFGSPLSNPLKPSKFDFAKFGRYLGAVENPIGVMGKIKNCSIQAEDVETLQNVYPKLYQDMTQSLTAEIANQVSKGGVDQIPYKTKVALSLFMNQDMDNSLAQTAIASNQMALGGQGQPQSPAPPPKSKSPQSGLAKLSGADSMLTSAQASSQRPAV